MIRKANSYDLDNVLNIYNIARDFMHSHGNPTQWAGKYPDRETLIDDIYKGQLYVVIDEKNDKVIYGCFALIPGIDPTYLKIYDGEWKDTSDYAAIHRVASSGTKRGIFSECFEYAKRFYNHLRVDTHADNKPMQGAVAKCGFEYCGIIHLANGDPRLAYEWIER